MNWQTIREHFPHSWMLLEAIDATTEKGYRIIHNFSVLDQFGDSFDNAWAQYKLVHKQDPYRQFYVIHTDREELDIQVLEIFSSFA